MRVKIGNIKGKDGKSAYEYAVAGGYEGTEQEFCVAVSRINQTMDYVAVAQDAAERADDAAERAENAAAIDSYYEAESYRELDNALADVISRLQPNKQERCIVSITSHPAICSYPMDALSPSHPNVPSGWARAGQYAKDSKIIKSDTLGHEAYFQFKRNGSEDAGISWCFIKNTVAGQVAAYGKNVSLKYSLMIDNEDLTGWSVYPPAFTDGTGNRPISFLVKDYTLMVQNFEVRKLTPKVWYDIKMVVDGRSWKLYIDNALVVDTVTGVSQNALSYVNMGISHLDGNGGNGKGVGMNIDNVAVYNNTVFTAVTPENIKLPGGDWIFEVTKAADGVQTVGYCESTVACRMDEAHWLVSDISCLSGVGKPVQEQIDSIKDVITPVVLWTNESQISAFMEQIVDVPNGADYPLWIVVFRHSSSWEYTQECVCRFANEGIAYFPKSSAQGNELLETHRMFSRPGGCSHMIFHEGYLNGVEDPHGAVPIKILGLKI